ncbi:MAG: hypothetical protein Q8L23_07395 [Caulobacter sp.]|nr:hypothetical protein [Caulobacter sp.]
MNPVRPPVWPPVPPHANGAGPAKTAAQRAFFEAALGKATGAPQAQATPVEVIQVRAEPVQRMPTAQPDEPPQKVLRPGSLLDIRV